MADKLSNLAKGRLDRPANHGRFLDSDFSGALSVLCWTAVGCLAAGSLIIAIATRSGGHEGAAKFMGHLFIYFSVGLSAGCVVLFFAQADRKTPQFRATMSVAIVCCLLGLASYFLVLRRIEAENERDFHRPIPGADR